MDEQKLLEFVLRFSDEVRHPLIADCDDWDAVKDALVWLEGVMPMWCQITDDEAMRNWMNIMRVFFESLYVAGYIRGKGESSTADIDELFTNDAEDPTP